MKKSSIYLILLGVIIVVVLLFALTNNTQEEIAENKKEVNNEEETIDNTKEIIDWRTTSFTDVKTQESFTIQSLTDKPILLESFAVWCPTCTQQQKKIKELHEELGDIFVSISLDTDPNEDEKRVLEHIERNNFDWFYAISPAEATKDLIDDFGVNVVNAPRAPLLLICNGSEELLKTGLKSVDFLKEKINDCVK